jgi:hypothetical protein
MVQRGRADAGWIRDAPVCPSRVAVHADAEICCLYVVESARPLNPEMQELHRSKVFVYMFDGHSDLEEVPTQQVCPDDAAAMGQAVPRLRTEQVAHRQSVPIRARPRLRWVINSVREPPVCES